MNTVTLLNFSCLLPQRGYQNHLTFPFRWSRGCADWQAFFAGGGFHISLMNALSSSVAASSSAFSTTVPSCCLHPGSWIHASLQKLREFFSFPLPTTPFICKWWGISVLCGPSIDSIHERWGIISQPGSHPFFQFRPYCLMCILHGEEFIAQDKWILLQMSFRHRNYSTVSGRQVYIAPVNFLFNCPTCILYTILRCDVFLPREVDGSVHKYTVVIGEDVSNTSQPLLAIHW